MSSLSVKLVYNQKTLFINKKERKVHLASRIQAFANRLKLYKHTTIYISTQKILVDKKKISLDEHEIKVLNFLFSRILKLVHLVVSIKQTHEEFSDQERANLEQSNPLSYHLMPDKEKWKEVVIKNKISSEPLHLLLCAHGRGIQRLDIEEVLKNWTRKEKTQLLANLGHYCPHLQYLNLKKNALDQSIAPYLANIKSLKHLYVKYNLISVNALYSLLRSLSDLEEEDINSEIARLERHLNLAERAFDIFLYHLGEVSP